MDIQARDEKLYISHNARHSVEASDRDGKELEVYSYPALVGTRLFARGGNRVVCLELNPD
jgi:hypothetical protein